MYPEHFKKHVRIHSGIKPFLCEVCGKAFNSRDNRNAHRYVHSDKKPYECMVCGTGYMRKPLLYAHMETANHLNDTIIINQPHISSKEGKEIVLSDTEEGSMNDTDIVYLNLNEEDLLDDEEYVRICPPNRFTFNLIVFLRILPRRLSTERTSLTKRRRVMRSI